MRVVVLLAVVWCGLAPGWAEVSLPAVFSDNMVLQQGTTVPVWGKAEPGEQVAVTLAGQTVESVAGADGKWRCALKSLKAGGPYTVTVRGKNTLTISNVLVGEVWFCGGQSNMEFPLTRATDGAAEAAAANYPTLRMFTARQVVAGTPQDNVAGKWVVCAPETAGAFSAVGYFFGREILQARKTPVGLLHASCGWTPAEAWMSREALLANPDFHYIVKRWDDSADPNAKTLYQQRLAEWQLASAKAKEEGKPEPPKPLKPADPNFIHRASGLWNGAVAPLIPYAIRGAIWYQGETNEVRAYQYRTLFPTLITAWRKAWGQGDFPFLFVQVAPVLTPDPTPVPSEWAELREAQALALALPKTGMAVTVDLGNLTEKGDQFDVHPKNKQDVGRRLGLAARALVYGEKVAYSGPVYKAMQVKGNTIRLTFTHAERGLLAGGDGGLHGFDIAGADQIFVHAQAKIDGKTVVVWSDAVPAPVAVRYGWANNPAGCNLYNGDHLPASPFRTDTWPEKTKGFTALTVDMM